MKIDHLTFQGVTLNELYDIERIFEVPIMVYELFKDGSAALARRSTLTEKNMFLNLYRNHFSYIKDFNQYARSHRCGCCDSVFNSGRDVRRHEKTCTGTTKLVFPGGVYKSAKSIFKELELLGLDLTDVDRFYRLRGMWDIETKFGDADLEDTETTKWEAIHDPMSVSIASNVPGFEKPTCIVSNDDPKELALKMVQYMLEVSDAASKFMRNKYAKVIEQLDEVVQTQQKELDQLHSDTNRVGKSEDLSPTSDDRCDDDETGESDLETDNEESGSEEPEPKQKKPQQKRHPH